MRLNIFARKAVVTHEGAPAIPHLSPEKQLRRTVLSCMLWEGQFYEDGQSIAERILAGAKAVRPEVLAALAIEARETFNLRHAPLLLLEALSRTGKGDRLVADTVCRVIQRADELAELVAVHHKLGEKKMIPAQMRKGLARAFAKFDEYGLAKYDRDAAVKLRDVLRLVRPTPKDDTQSALWRRTKDRELSVPDTWEVELSKGADKKATFERLIREGKLGYLALLRNLRNMAQAGCDEALVREAILARKGGAQRVLPFRYVAAARAAAQFEPALKSGPSGRDRGNAGSVGKDHRSRRRVGFDGRGAVGQVRHEALRCGGGAGVDPAGQSAHVQLLGQGDRSAASPRHGRRGCHPAISGTQRYLSRCRCRQDQHDAA